MIATKNMRMKNEITLNSFIICLDTLYSCQTFLLLPCTRTHISYFPLVFKLLTSFHFFSLISLNNFLHFLLFCSPVTLPSYICFAVWMQNIPFVSWSLFLYSQTTSVHLFHPYHSRLTNSCIIHSFFTLCLLG